MIGRTAGCFPAHAGYPNRIQSSRQLEREAGRNVEVMWLTERFSPDHKTVADYRKDNGPAIRNVCARFVTLCPIMELFTGAIVSIDGSKFKAVNNRDKNFTMAKITSFAGAKRNAEGRRARIVAGQSRNLTNHWEARGLPGCTIQPSRPRKSIRSGEKRGPGSMRWASMASSAAIAFTPIQCGGGRMETNASRQLSAVAIHNNGRRPGRFPLPSCLSGAGSRRFVSEEVIPLNQKVTPVARLRFRREADRDG
jgi:hypothetical protein